MKLNPIRIEDVPIEIAGLRGNLTTELSHSHVHHVLRETKKQWLRSLAEKLAHRHDYLYVRNGKLYGGDRCGRGSDVETCVGDLSNDNFAIHLAFEKIFNLLT